MPDFPRSATPAEVWAYGARTITALTGTPRSDLLGEDADFELGTGARKAKIDNVDELISSRSSHAAADIWGIAVRTITALTGTPRTDLIGEDASFEAAAGRPSKLDAAISSRSTHAAGDVWAVATRALTTLAGTPRTELIGEDVSFEAATGRPAKIPRLDAIPAYETAVEASIVMDGTEKTLVEKTDDKIGLLDGYVDLTTMEAGDTIVIRQSMKVKAAGTYVVYATETYSGVQSTPLLHVITKTAKTSIMVTAQQTGGTNRTLDVQFFRRLQA